MTEGTDNSEFCEDCMYEPDCPWYRKPLLEYVGDDTDKQLTILHNINQNDNATSGNFQACVYNVYLMEKDMDLTDKTFEKWNAAYQEEGNL